MRVTWAEPAPAALLDGPAHARAPASGSAGSANIEEMPPPPSRPASNADAPASTRIFLQESPVIQEQNLSSTSDSRWKKQMQDASEADAGRSWGGNTWSRSAWDYNK
jgi:hypothetical protein